MRVALEQIDPLYIVVVVGQLGFAYDGVKLRLYLLAPGCKLGPHVSVEADRLRMKRVRSERTIMRRALAAEAQDNLKIHLVCKRGHLVVGTNARVLNTKRDGIIQMCKACHDARIAARSVRGKETGTKALSTRREAQ